MARDSLGVFGEWAAFRDPAVPRCYAIAMAAPSTKQRDYQPYADIGTWPRQNLRGQVHFRLSRKLQPGAAIVLSLGGERFQLTGGVSFLVKDVATGTSVFGASVTALDTYTRSSQNFSNMRARRDAEDRLAKALAELTQARLAAYFATH